MLARGHKSFYALLFLLGLHINLSELHITPQFSFLVLCWDTVDMSMSLTSDKLLETWQMAHCLLQRQPFTVHQAMSSLDKTTFCANGHVQICQFCHVIQSDMLNVYHS